MADEILRGWTRVQVNLPRIVNYGRQQGILPPVEVDVKAAQIGFAKLIKQAQKAINQQGDKVNIPTDDVSSIHEAIPFLPLSAALPCFVLNICLPGTGTMASGLLSMVVGQPRIQVKEGRGFASAVVNTCVGCSQAITVLLFLVGWFWSMAWGGLIVFHSLQYREALVNRRKEAVAIAAIEALTKDSILHRREVKKIVKKK